MSLSASKSALTEFRSKPVANTPTPLSLLKHFLEHQCEFSSEYQVTKAEFYDSYREFILLSGLAPLKINDVGKTMKSKFSVEEGRTKGERFWKGLRVKKKDEESDEVSVASKELPTSQTNMEQVCEELLEPVAIVTPPPHQSAVDELILRDLIGVWEIRKF